MRRKLITILLMALLMVMASAVVCFAADGDYTYKVKVHAGNVGTYKGDKSWNKTCKPGESVYITIKDVKVTNDKYYVRGFRIAGHDNDETERNDAGNAQPSGFTSATFNANADVSYEVAYGIKGSMVSYLVKYVDTDGNALTPDGSDSETDEYFGMVGDKPVVSYRYVDGYTPDAYNLSKTLSSDSDKNVFTFTYTKNGTETPDNGDNGDNGDNNGNNNNNANNANRNAAANPANAPGTAANPAGTNAAATPGNNQGNQGTTNIGDSDTPLADGPGQQYADLDDGQTPQSDFDGDKEGGISKLPIIIGSIIAAILLLLLIIWLVSRRRKNDDDGMDGMDGMA